MRHFTYFHCYTEELWEGYKRNGMLGEHFGIRCPQTISLPSERLFNSILKKGGRLYNYIKEHRCPLYIDRLQGGGYFFEYDYDKALIEEYRDLLGKDFLGFQFHEWLSNYKHDTGAKLGTLPAEKWTEENIRTRSQELADAISEDMKKDCLRWQDRSHSQWVQQVAALQNMAAERQRYVTEHIQAYFHLSDAQMRSYGFLP